MPSLKKFVLIVAPHTSNWDFFVGIAARSILRLKSKYLAKNSLFNIPVVGWLLSKLGGFPVDRSKNSNMVEQVAEMFSKKDRLVVTLTPEGTRSYVPKWKTGFYWIAHQANVPIVMVGFDYRNKTVEVKEPFYPTGDIEKDLPKILKYYRSIRGKYPENGVR